MSNTSLLGSFGGQAGDALMFRNRIVNGCMRIDQRNAGAAVTTEAYCLDRWRTWMSAAPGFSVQQNAGSVTPPAGFTNYLGCTVTNAITPGASQRWSIQQSIEGFNVADLAWGTANAQSVAVSFWARSSLTGTLGGVIRNSAGNRAYPFTYSVSAANTWEYKTVIIPGDTSGTWLTNNGIGLSLVFSLGAGSSLVGAAGSWAGSDLWSATGSVNVIATAGATLYITGVQLESGAATPFERRPIGTELALCQRYFEKSFIQSVAPANNTGDNRLGSITSFATVNVSTAVYFKVSKRASGTVTLYNPVNATANTISVFINGSWVTSAPRSPSFDEHRIDLEVQVTGASTGSSYLISAHWTASAEL